MEANRHPYYLQSLGRGLDVLERLSEHDYALTELGAALHLPLSNIHRLVSTLQTHGYVERNPANRRYRLAAKTMQLAAGYMRQGDERSRLRSVLTELSAATDATAHLAALHEGVVTYLDTIESSSVVYVRSSIGTGVPAHCTAIGWVLLAFADDQTIAAALTETRLEANSRGINRAALTMQFEEIRHCGYAISIGQFREDVIGVAAPVFDFQGRVSMAIGILLPNLPSTAPRLNALGASVRESGLAASLLLGAQIRNVPAFMRPETVAKEKKS